jgi:hypothetical protein
MTAMNPAAAFARQNGERTLLRSKPSRASSSSFCASSGTPCALSSMKTSRSAMHETNSCSFLPDLSLCTWRGARGGGGERERT